MPWLPRWSAALRMVTTPLRVSSSMRALTNWFGNSARSALGNFALSFTVPVVTSITLSTVRSSPAPSLTRNPRSQASTESLALPFMRCRTAGRLSCGSANTTVTGWISVITTTPSHSHGVAGFRRAQPQPPADRRGDAGIGKLQPRVVDHRLVRAHRALVLAHQRGLGVDLLLGDRVLLEQRLVALEVDARVREQRLVLDELALGLVELNLEGPGIDLREHLPLFYILPFGEVDADELAVHAAADDDRAHRHHGAQAAEIDRDIARLSRFGRHGDRAAIAALCAAPLPGLLGFRLRRGFAAAGLVVIEPCADAGGHHDHSERDEQGGAPLPGFHCVLHGDSFRGPHFTTSSPATACPSRR